MTDEIIDRQAEVMVVDDLLADATPQMRVLAFEGPAGTEKTVLWRGAVERAVERGFRVLACRSAHAETRLSFAVERSPLDD